MDNAFFIEYIKNFSIEPLVKQSKLAVLKLKSLKTEKGKQDYVIILYSSYIQIIENFIIFMLVLYDDNNLDNIFEKSPQKITERFYKLFGIEKNKLSYSGKEQLKNILKSIFSKDFPEDVLKNYVKFISESLEDYIKDKDFLNGFKHGIRVHSTGKIHYTMHLDGSNQGFDIGNYDASIKFFSKQNNGNTIIYENSVSFNYEYIDNKIYFLKNTLENLKIVTLNKKKLIRIQYFLPPKENILLKFGTTRIKNPLFIKQ